MDFFKDMKEKASKDPKIVVLPELDKDEDGILRKAMEIVKDEGTAIPIGLTLGSIENSGKLEEFAEAYEAKGNMTIGAKVRFVRKPLAFSALMVKLGYAHGMVTGKYTDSATVMAYVNHIIGEEEGKIRSATFFRETPKNYNIFDLVAISDMVANPNPTAEELYRIIVTSAETFEALTDKKPKIALLSYVTGFPKEAQFVKDPELKKINDTIELYKERKHPWLLYQTQADAALIPSIAQKKGAPFKEPADLLIGSNLTMSNNVYKLFERLIYGGDSMIVTQGLQYPAMDLSRGDSVSNIVNTINACSVQAQKIEQKKGYRSIDTYFLDF